MRKIRASCAVIIGEVFPSQLRERIFFFFPSPQGMRYGTSKLGQTCTLPVFCGHDCPPCPPPRAAPPFVYRVWPLSDLWMFSSFYASTVTLCRHVGGGFRHGVIPLLLCQNAVLKSGGVRPACREVRLRARVQSSRLFSRWSAWSGSTWPSMDFVSWRRFRSMTSQTANGLNWVFTVKFVSWCFRSAARENREAEILKRAGVV